MIHETTGRYWKKYHTLPVEIRSLADKKFAQLKENPQHPSLHFKKIKNFWSVRVGLSYRALGLDVPGKNTVIWFWIGNHQEYEQLIS